MPANVPKEFKLNPRTPSLDGQRPSPKAANVYTTTWPTYVGFNEIRIIKFESMQQIQTVDLCGGSAIAITSPWAMILGSVHPQTIGSEFIDWRKRAQYPGGQLLDNTLDQKLLEGVVVED
ncbi:hypothetical protein VTN77DRAFT_8464 [Rasamsonia byssochlamydoides]|uniref:uncharacterized protein n=1 Tax=Rasamsonia byssochlamydoides TaxID=89139 RepID=UPI003742FC20